MKGNLGCLRPGDVIASASDIDELLRYRELKKQGRLITLPCAVGDTVWEVFKYSLDTPREEYCILKTEFEPNDIELIGKTVFLTREEAEAALKGAKE